MKNPKTMSYKELGEEVTANRCKMDKANLKTREALIRRNHELMVEMDRRWNAK